MGLPPTVSQAATVHLATQADQPHPITMSATELVPGLYRIAVGQVNSFFLDASPGGVLIDAGFS